ncbi:FadR/GntR family transcriptional regulator [uncultured Cohaesibacter sp.]|uniref:FadR/GntR family transcriptional regulator n=1 Tax=uncultured Cohaesibacter sp. TaxID=1002546 RepID=UPI002A0A8911|nr:FadR/GntR family transcriptional regulator [uncultured Cohaesibacter sp.]
MQVKPRSWTANALDQLVKRPVTQSIPTNQKAPSLADAVYEALLSRIVTGVYPENSKLPTEAELAEDLGASRPTVRAAIARLRESGLVASRRGSGSFVLKRPDDSFLQFAPIESIADIQRSYEYRIMLEGEAAYFAAERAGVEHLDKMSIELKRMDDAIETGDMGTGEDYRFHLAICEAADNHFFVSSFQALTEVSLQAMDISRNLSSRSKQARRVIVQEEHHRIFNAIRARDMDAARMRMQEHIRNARRRIFEGPLS